MRVLLLSFIFASTASFAQGHPACDILKSKAISFRNNNSNDYLEISVSGKTCLEAALRITLTTEQGELIYSYESDYKRHLVIYGEDKEFDQATLRHVNKMVLRAIKTSSSLPDSSYICFKGEGECIYDQYSDLSLERYNQIKAHNVPVLYHSTYSEGGSAYIFDVDSKRTIQILDWGA